MIIIVCIDDDKGTMFNHRRQSQDRILRERILEMTRGVRLWMNKYSFQQFAGENALQINVDDDFLNRVALGDYCFVEDGDVTNYEKHMEKIILYKWNRLYPSDEQFNIPLQENGWKLVASTDFVGASHNKITEEIYEK